MRRRNMKVVEENDAHVDMTPMLDIIFILLIFFIVTTSFVKEKGFLVNKTEASKSQNNTSEDIMIHIDENNTIFFNNKMVDIVRIPARVEFYSANHATENIIFRPHEETNYQLVVDVLDQLKQFAALKVKMGTYRP